MKKILISVIGPTALGNTTLAIALANYYKTAIVSADSRQFYKEMKIGTAVPSEEELKTAPHHFIQHKSIFESRHCVQWGRSTGCATGRYM